MVNDSTPNNNINNVPSKVVKMKSQCLHAGKDTLYLIRLLARVMSPMPANI